MKKLLLAAALTMVSAPAWADGDAATITSSPSPAIAGQPVTVTIKTTAWSGDVYVYSWVVIDNETKHAAEWSQTNTDQYKMGGSNGTYTFTVSDMKSFWHLSDDQLKKLTKLNFIAKSASGSQTADLSIDCSQEAPQRYGGGQGTQSAPWKIASAAHLSELASTSDDWAAGKYFTLENDVDASSLTKPIGSASTPFKGSFDGNGHCISGLSLKSNAWGEPTALFGVIDGGTVSDLGVTAATIEGTDHSAILVGKLVSGTVTRCFTTGSVKSQWVCAGGLAGENVAGKIAECYSTASVTNTADYATGGLVGKNAGSISNCYATGDVNGYNFVGGLAGANYGRITSSIAVNSSVTSTHSFAAHFAGNDNSENVTSGAYSWSNMPVISSHEAFGHKAAVTDAVNFNNLNAFKQILPWSFSDTWEWKEVTNAGKKTAAPLLRGISGQSPSFPVDIFSGLQTVAADKDGQATVIAGPNPTDGPLSVSSSAEIAGIRIYSLNGAMVLGKPGNGTTDIDLDLSALPAGLYILEVQTSGAPSTIVKIIRK